MHTWPVVMNVAPLILRERRLVEHRVVQDERRVVAAELKCHVGDVRRGHRHDPLAAADRAGEADVPDPRVADDDRADHVVRAGDHVEHARRQRANQVPERLHRRQRRGGRRLHDHRVAGHQRGGQGRGEDRERPVERVDDRDDAAGQPGDRRVERRALDVLLDVELGRVLRRLVEAAGEDGEVDERLEPDLPVLPRQDVGARVIVGLEPVERLQHDRDPLGRGHRGPGGPRRLGGGDRRERVVAPTPRRRSR